MTIRVVQRPCKLRGKVCYWVFCWEPIRGIRGVLRTCLLSGKGCIRGNGEFKGLKERGSAFSWGQ